MKKTIYTAALLLGSAALATADSLTATTNAGTGGPGYPNSNNAPFGYVVDFDNALTFSMDDTTLSGYDTISLNSITLNSLTSGSAKVAVFSLPGTVATESNRTALTFCGVSDLTTITSNSDTTFTFSTAVDISTTGSYAFYFVNDAITTETLTGATSFSDIEANAQRFRFQHSWTNVGNVYEHRDGGGWANESPVVSYSFTATKASAGDAIPEPTTATLSLLALAGLAARRRRK